jgi:HD-GYP domain-containing protein (c-di-GMP phosphodiesterase class II)
MAARIVSICDVYSALREERAYKPGMTHEDAVRALLLGDASGRTRPGMFDPELLSIFGREHQRFAHAIQELSSAAQSRQRISDPILWARAQSLIHSKRDTTKRNRQKPP